MKKTKKEDRIIGKIFSILPFSGVGLGVSVLYKIWNDIVLDLITNIFFTIILVFAIFMLFIFGMGFFMGLK